jgi:hypothetical protein
MKREQDLQCLHNNDIVIECHHNSERECFHKCEGRQQNEVQRMAVAFPVEHSEVDQGPKKRHVEGPSA